MKKAGIALVLFLLAACGFQPLYAERGNADAWYGGDASVTDEMALIKIPSISERFGQLVRNDLLDLLTPRGAPKNAKYRLEVKLIDRIVTQQAMRNDVTATNERIQYSVGYTMYEGTKSLVRGNSIAFVSYDILQNPYSTTMAQKKAETDAAKIIANDIALRIGAYFHTQMNGGAK